MAADHAESFAVEAWKYFSVSEQDDPYLTDSDVLDNVTRKDGKPFDSDDEAALLPYHGFVGIATAFADMIADMTEADDDDQDCERSVLGLMKRKDGAPFDDEDDSALLPYGGLLGAAALLSVLLENKHEFFSVINGMGAGDFGEAGAAVAATTDSLIVGLARRDGSPFDDQDEAALLEFGSMITLVQAIGSVPLVGDLEAPVTGVDVAVGSSYIASTLRLPCLPADPFEGLTRVDGEPFDEDDEAALRPFAPLLYFNTMIDACSDGIDRGIGLFPEADPDLTTVGENWGADSAQFDEDDGGAWRPFAPLLHLNTMIDACSDGIDRGIGLFPEADPDITTVGETWGEEQAELESTWYLRRKDGRAMDAEDEAALAAYGAWTAAGTLFLAVYRKTFGSLQDLTGTSSSASMEMPGTGGLKRRPSGAELSAYIGLATQKTLGLDDPNRKVRTRGIL